MASHLNYIVLIAMAIATFANAGVDQGQFRGKLSTLEIRPDMMGPTNLGELTHRVEARKNQVIVNSYAMPLERVYAGMERLSYLLDYNTKNKELLTEMQIYFVNHFHDLDWHFVLEDTTAGSFPLQYVYYSFDRNNTQLFVGGYKFC